MRGEELQRWRPRASFPFFRRGLAGPCRMARPVYIDRVYDDTGWIGWISDRKLSRANAANFPLTAPYSRAHLAVPPVTFQLGCQLWCHLQGKPQPRVVIRIGTGCMVYTGPSEPPFRSTGDSPAVSKAAHVLRHELAWLHSRSQGVLAHRSITHSTGFTGNTATPYCDAIYRTPNVASESSGPSFRSG